MNINFRICIEKEHENFQATYLCNYKDCELLNKWCCTQCIKQGIHKHDKKNFTHIIPWQDIQVKKQKEIRRLLESQLFTNRSKLCESVIIIINQYKQLMEQYLQKIEKQKETLELLLLDLSEEKFIQLDDQRVHEIIQLDYNQSITQFSLIEPIENFDKKIKHLETFIKEYQEKLKLISHRVDLKQTKYIVKQIDKVYGSFFQSQISNNEQYLAYEGKSRDVMKIYDIKQEKIVKEIIVDNLLYICQFSSDSQLLYVGNGRNVYCYNLLKNFKKLFGLSIHKEGVLNIKIIQDRYLLTCSFDKTIRKTDIKRRKLIFKLLGHTQMINTIDYNDIDNLLLSGSADRSIKLWDCNSKSIIINKEQSHLSRIVQIQLTNDKYQFLSLDDSSNLYKWRIDINQKDFIIIQQFIDPQNIYSFSLINQNQNLLLICGFHIKILNDQGEIINTIQHEAGIDFRAIECRQLDNGKFIHIRSERKIMLLIAQD